MKNKKDNLVEMMIESNSTIAELVEALSMVCHCAHHGTSIDEYREIGELLDELKVKADIALKREH